MNKKFIVQVSILGALVIIIAAIFIFNKQKNVSPAPIVSNNTETENNTATSTETSGTTEPTNATETPQSFKNVPFPTSNQKEIAWSLFQKYLEYNKENNLDGVKSAVYKISDVCADVAPSDTCKARMNSAYSYGSALKKEEITNVWSDGKQIILATDFKVTSGDNTINRARALIFFVKDDSGNMKMLSFSPARGSTVTKGGASEEELNDRLITYTEDNDKDGMADYIEECVGKSAESTCVKTDPQTRDTDGDGWWDGVEALFI